MKAIHERDSVLWLECALLSCLLFLFFFSATQAALTEVPESSDTLLAAAAASLLATGNETTPAVSVDRSGDMAEPEASDSEESLGSDSPSLDAALLPAAMPHASDDRLPEPETRLP